MQFDLLIFDLDGTLVDSLPDIAGAVNHVLREWQLAPLELDQVKGCVGDGVLALATKALALRPGAHGLEPATVARGIQAYYREHVCVDSKLYPAIEATVRALKASGRRLAVLTNKPGDVARPLLQALGITDCFDAIIGDGDGFPRKPAPEAAHALLDRFGVVKERALMVGDGLPDLAIARAVGCPCAAAAWGYTDHVRLSAERPAWIVEAPADLLGIAFGRPQVRC